MYRKLGKVYKSPPPKISPCRMPFVYISKTIKKQEQEKGKVLFVLMLASLLILALRLFFHGETRALVLALVSALLASLVEIRQE